MAADHYAVLNDVNALIPQVPFTALSKPTAPNVAAWIDIIATEMDASLSSVGYATPVTTGPIALQLLRQICAYGVLGLAQASRGTGVDTAVSGSGKEVKNIWLQMYESRMKALCDPQDPFELSDATRTNEQLEKQPENVLRSSVQGITDVDWTEPAVTRYQVL